MSEVVLRSDGLVTLLGGGECRPVDLADALSRAPRLVAVDGGAAGALAAGHVPELVVGDMDSLAPDIRSRLGARVHLIAEQESTDFAKALRSVAAPVIIGVGFLGARLDHELAAMSVLAASERRCVLLGPHDVVFAAAGSLRLDLPPATRLSLFPMADLRGRSEGLAWPIDEIDFAPAGRIGTSNVTTGAVSLSFDRPGMLVLLPRSELDAVLEALAR